MPVINRGSSGGLPQGFVQIPLIISPAEGAFILPTTFAFEGTPFATVGMSDTLKAVTIQVAKDVAFTNLVYNQRHATSTPTVTVTFPAQTPGAVLYARIKYEGNGLGESEWGAARKLAVATVNAPTIISPAAGATVYASAVTITTAAFACPGGISDTHASTDWKITLGAAGNNVVVQALNSANKTSHTFTGLNVTDGRTYYLWARHNGTSCGASPWSAARSVIIKAWVATAGGRVLYRHASGKGTVMEFNDGQARKVMVLDARYRNRVTWGTYGYNMPNLTNYSNSNTREDWYLNTSNGQNTNAATKMTDAQINSLWSGSIDNKTAKQNCDQWMTRNSTSDSGGTLGVPAVAYARGISVDAKTCDVPNIQTLMRIFLEADELDKLDPTVAANKTKALGTQNSYGFWDCMGTTVALSSTEHSSNSVRIVGKASNCTSAFKNHECFVVPVQEL